MLASVLSSLATLISSREPSQDSRGRHRRSRLFALVVAGSLLHPPVGRAQSTRSVILATTTSTQDSGLLDSLIPPFERRCHCEVKTVAVGTGQALALGGRGEADVVLVHAPTLEMKYLTAGMFVDRRLVMTNDFVLVGPPADPAGIKGSRSLMEALRRLAAGPGRFVSRADSSGTDLLERRLWKEAGVHPGTDRYLEVGQGMGATLRVTSEKSAYTLSDRGTYLALRPRIELQVVFEGSPELLNIYHVMRPNPDSFPKVNQEGGRAFADFVVSPDAQALIGRLGVTRFGRALFRPAAGQAEPVPVPGR
jgi:tungstate transport system substrate-binding protein